MSFAMLRKSLCEGKSKCLFPPYLLKCLGTEQMSSNSHAADQPCSDFQLAFCCLLNLEAGFLTVGNEHLSALRELFQQGSFLSQKLVDSVMPLPVTIPDTNHFSHWSSTSLARFDQRPSSSDLCMEDIAIRFSEKHLTVSFSGAAE